MADLSVDIGGIRFKNPIVAAAGEPTTDYEHMVAAIEAGAGGIIAKSIAFSEQLAKSYDHPRWAVIDENRKACSKGKYPKMFTFYGRGGIPLEPPRWMDTLKKVCEIAEEHGAVLIGSIATGPLERMEDAARRMQEAGIRIIELDAGCPQVSQLGLENGTMELIKSYEIAEKVTKSITSVVDIPVIYKVAAEDKNILETCLAVKKAGAAAVTLLNRFVGFLVDIETGKPHIGSKGGVGGPWVLPLTLRWISETHQLCPDLTILGSNGAYDWQDAVQFLMSGATIVQYCSVLMLKGYGVITDTIKDLDKFMDLHGYPTINSMVGLAVKNSKTYEEFYGCRLKAVINKDKCIFCGKCIKACFYQGLKDDGGTIEVTEFCKGCGMCRAICPVEAIKFVIP